MGDGLAMKNNSPNKMETMPVKKLVINVSVPLMISLLVQSLYNIVDSIFVARISEEALTATSLAYPVQMLMIAVSVGTGVGINSLISRKIGAKDYEAVGNISTTGFLLGAASSLVFVLFGTFLAPWFFSLYTQDAALLAGIVMAVGTFLFNVIPARLLGLYHASEAMLEMGVPALRILSLIFISTAIVLVIGYAYTGMGNGMVNMVGTLLRQLLPVPIIYFAAKYAGVDRVWYVFWFSDICALTYALLTIRNTYQKVLKPMGEKSADACDRAD